MFSVYIRRAEENKQIIFPNRFCSTDEDCEKAEIEDIQLKSLEGLKRQKGPYEYGCQYLNDPVNDDSIEFRREWVRKFDHDDETFEKLKDVPCLITVDPAFKLRETHDDTGIVISKATTSGIYILEAMGVKLSVDKLIDKIFELVNIYKPSKVKIETVAAQILLIDILQKEMTKRGVMFMLDEYHPGTTQTKATRIRKLIPYYANGQILHRRGLVDLEEQLIQFPRGRKDDIIDALAAHVDEWNPMTHSPRTQNKEYSWSWWKKKSGRSNSTIHQLFKDLGRSPY